MGRSNGKFFLSEKNVVTELIMEKDNNDEFEKYFSVTFPKAIVLIKQIAEK